MKKLVLVALLGAYTFGTALAQQGHPAPPPPTPKGSKAPKAQPVNPQPAPSLEAANNPKPAPPLTPAPQQPAKALPKHGSH